MGKLVNFCAGTNAHILPAKKAPAILVNILNNAKNTKEMGETRFLFKYAQTKRSIVDSSGYQFAQGEIKNKIITYNSSKPALETKEHINLAPEHVIAAAADIKPTIVMALDFPIGPKSADYNEQEREFMTKLGFNSRWAKACSLLRGQYCPDVKLFLPMQCYDLQQFDIFMDLIGDISFDGFSIPVRNFDIKGLALFLLKFFQTGKRETHILGTSEFFTIALAAYMARHFFDWVSFDATTWRRSAEDSIYLNRHDLTSEYIGRVNIDERIKNDCECPFCKRSTFTTIKNTLQTERIRLLREHNFWVIEKATKDLYEHADTALGLKHYLMRKSPDIAEIEKLYEAICLIDAFKDKDIRVVESMLL